MNKKFFTLLILMILGANCAYAYLDPGTSSMIFTIIVGTISYIFFLLYPFWEKIKSIILKGFGIKKVNTEHPIVIYTESKRYYHVFNDIIDEFEKRQYPLLVYVSDNDDDFLTKKYNYVKVKNIGTGNKAYLKLAFLKADVCLMTTPGIDVYQLRRSKNVKHYAHIYHSLGDGLIYRLYGTDYYDSILTNTELMHEYIRILEKKRNLPEKELVVTGAPYMDSMSRSLPAAHRISDKTTVLLSPTWGDSAILANFGEKLITALSKSDFYVIIRPHPQSLISEKNLIDFLVNKFKDKTNIKWDFSSDNLEAMTVSDIMITDVSGIIYEYAFLFNKPFIYSNANFNINLYDAKDVGIETFKTKTFKTIGKELKEENIDDIENIINSILSDNIISSEIEKLKNEIWRYQ